MRVLYLVCALLFVLLLSVSTEIEVTSAGASAVNLASWFRLRIKKKAAMAMTSVRMMTTPMDFLIEAKLFISLL
jgi:hypothetical protein